MKMPRLMFKQFRDLTTEDLKCDYHVHTARTDGRADIEAVLEEAVNRGLSRVAVTEHVRRDTTWFAKFVQEVLVAAIHYPQLQVWVGCEAKALDSQGGLDASDQILELCDIVLGSVHRFPDGQGGLLQFDAVPESDFARIEFELAMGLVTAAPIHVLAHPGGMYAKHFGVDWSPDLMRELMIKALERGVAVEISSSYLRDFTSFLKLCAEINPFVSIGSDMHRLEQLGLSRDKLVSSGVGNQ